MKSFRLNDRVFLFTLAILVVLLLAWPNGIPQANAESDIARIQKAAEQGDAKAQLQLGHGYANGQYGLPEDFDKAFRWYEKSALQGNAEAQYNAGYTLIDTYAGHEKTDQDKNVEAYMWFSLAAQNSDTHWADLATRDRPRCSLTSEQRSRVQVRIAEIQSMIDSKKRTMPPARGVYSSGNLGQNKQNGLVNCGELQDNCLRKGGIPHDCEELLNVCAEAAVVQGLNKLGIQ